MTATARKTVEPAGPMIHPVSLREAEAAALDPWPPFPPEGILGGDPNGHRGKVLFRSPDGLYSVGIWECPPAKFVEPYPGSEFGHVLKGRARLRDVATGDTRDIAAGDHFFIEFNREIEWEVLETFRKIYTMYEAEWLDGRFY